MPGTAASLLEYYRSHEFNPVPIAVEDRAVWEDHFTKRRNLYERHLGIPLRLLRGCRVLEFGCNSGENALVLAAHGAELTLAEPNEQVLPRLHSLFAEFGLQDRIARLEQQGMDEFVPDGAYDLVVAEGFLSTLSDRDELLAKMCRTVGPGGLGIMSFNDLHGSLQEQTRRALLYRACELADVDDPRSPASLALADRLFREDFSRLSASRAFEVWWQDQLVNPFLESQWLWSYGDILEIVEREGCEFHASSPRWARLDEHTWYKKIDDIDERRRRLRTSWLGSLPYILTGIPANEMHPPAPGAVAATAALIDAISAYTKRTAPVSSLAFPASLAGFLQSCTDDSVRRFGRQLGDVYGALQATSVDALITAWHEAKDLRNLWGTPYHYLCFTRNPEVSCQPC